jgi:hypothetical protein
MEPYFKLVVVDDDEVAKVKDDVAPANTCTNNTNSLDKRGPVMHPAAAPGIKWKARKRAISLQYKKKGKDM